MQFSLILNEYTHILFPSIYLPQPNSIRLASHSVTSPMKTLLEMTSRSDDDNS